MKALGTGFPTTIREAEPRDAAEVHALLRECFGHEYEAQLVARLRAERAMLVELVAARSAPPSAPLLGHVAFSTLAIEANGGTLRAAALAPLAVRPEARRQGLGAGLVQAGIDRCRRLGLVAVVVLGDPAYYARFGFSAALAQGLEAPFHGDAFQALELAPRALAGISGRLRYASAFGLGG